MTYFAEITPKRTTMKKVKLLLFAFVAAFVLSCGDDNPLKKCVQCTEKKSGTKADEYCGNKVAVETYKTTLKNTSGQDWECVDK